jgi:hypothetical protein
MDTRFSFGDEPEDLTYQANGADEDHKMMSPKATMASAEEAFFSALSQPSLNPLCRGKSSHESCQALLHGLIVIGRRLAAVALIDAQSVPGQSGRPTGRSRGGVESLQNSQAPGRAQHVAEIKPEAIHGTHGTRRRRPQ